MNFTDAVKVGLTNYANFSGRSGRPEFWWFALFCAVVNFVSMFLGDIINLILTLALLVPTFAVGARRLHDLGKSGWWQLLVLTVIGAFLLLYWAAQPGTDGPNEFGAPAPQAA